MKPQIEVILLGSNAPFEVAVLLENVSFTPPRTHGHTQTGTQKRLLLRA